MTKFKEYLMAHGAILERNSAELARDENWDVEFIIPQVLDSGLAVNYCHVDDHMPDVVVYDRSGARSYIARSEYQAYRKASHCDAEYIDFMLDMDPDTSDFELTVMRNTYEDHAKIRIAFKHMKAGLMDERTFCKLALRYRFY